MFDINNKSRMVQAYIDGQLNAEQNASFLADCEKDHKLNEELEHMQALDAELMAMAEAADIEPPIDLAMNIHQLIAAEPNHGQKAPVKTFSWRMAAPACAAAALLLAVGIAGIMPESPSVHQENTSAVIAENTTTAVIEQTATAAETTSAAIENTTIITEETTAAATTAPVIEPTVAAPETTVVAPETTTAPEPDTVVIPSAPIIEQTTVAAAEKTTAAPEPTEPTKPADTEEVNNGTISMPVPAAQSTSTVTGLQVMRFGIDEGDAYSPFVNDVGEIQFYTNYEDQTALCTMMDATASVKIIKNASVEKINTIASDEPMTIKFSPDGTQVAANMGGADTGLWVADDNIDNAAVQLSLYGGGTILEWAPNSGRLVFTDADGRLFIAYIAEGLVMPICDTPVYSVIWLSNSRGLIYETVDDNDRRVICKVALP